MTTALPPAEVLIYQWTDGSLELKGDVDWETIWANLDQIASLFWRDKSVISRHIKNIFKDEELEKKMVVAFFATTKKHGYWTNKTQTKQVVFYNLDMILSIWYRVNSRVATAFRQRATQTLKQHMTQWFTINRKVIQRNYDLFLHAVEDIKQLNNQHTLPTDDILELIRAFGKTWFSLDAFDKQDSTALPHTITDIKIEAKKLYDSLAVLKEELLKKWEATDLFGQEKASWALEGIFANVFQSAFWEDVYPSIESKATHLLYFIIKNHPFNDGNKRSGAFAFIWFLKQTNHTLSGITPEALTALTLLVAASDPKEKEKVIWLIMLLLVPTV